MNFKSEKGFTGIDISIAIVVLFIFITIVSILAYNINSLKREIELKSEALYLAINEIEEIKLNGIVDGEEIEVENEEIKEGFFKTVTTVDYTELEGNEGKIRDLVKEVKVKISYMFKSQQQDVEISTLITR